MNNLFILYLGIGLVVYRVGFKFISNTTPSTSMVIMGLVLLFCGLIFGGIKNLNNTTLKDFMGILMISFATFFVDYGYVKLIQLGYSPSILNIVTALLGLVGSILIFWLFFNDQLTYRQLLGISFSIVGIYFIYMK